MPWKNLPPDVLHSLLQVAALVLAGVVGSTSRITEQIARGERAKVWGKDLLVDISSFSIMLLVSYGLVDYYQLSTPAAVALTGLLCRAGTSVLDTIIKMFLQRGSKA